MVQVVEGCLLRHRHLSRKPRLAASLTNIWVRLKRDYQANPSTKLIQVTNLEIFLRAHLCKKTTVWVGPE